MKSGATFLIGITSDIDDIEKVESVIFTIRGKEELQKNYPEDVAFDENHNFLIPLTQEETTLLAGQYGHKVLVEGQVNFVDKSVNKTETVDFFISGTLATEIIEGNTPSSYPITEISLKFMDGIVIADLDPDAFDEKIAEKVAELTADMQEEIDAKVEKVDGKGLSTEDFTTEEKEKLATVESGAQKNKVNSVNSKTGDVVLTALNIGALPDTTTHLSGDIPVSQKGVANGVAELDENGKVISSQLPSYVDDVLEFPKVSDFPKKGESGKIYIATSTNLSYRWTGSDYTVISPSIALGETSSTAYRGDRGKTAYDHSQTIGNPHQTTKADVGLNNVDNTSDANKPVSTATQTALNKKVDKVSGKSLISDSEIERLASVHNYDDTEIKAEIDEKADKSDVGISDVATGTEINDSADGFIKNFVANGKCEQDGIPAPESPVEIKCWDGNITTYNGTYQSIADLRIELLGIKVSDGGNYTDTEGQQWLCDKIDLGKGVIVRALEKVTLTSSGNDVNWKISSSYPRAYYSTQWASHRGIANTPNHIQSHFATTKTNAGYVPGTCYFNNAINLRFADDSEIDTLDKFLAWIDENPLALVVNLANPVEEALTEEQMSELRKLQTYSEGTTVLYGELEPFAELYYWKGNNNGQSVADVDAKIPFSFGVEDGVYGYYTGKRGADTFHPFSSGGSSKPTYLIVNQGNGVNVLDFSNFEETFYSNSDMMSGIVQITPYFHIVFHNIQRNCLTLCADSKISVQWRRSYGTPKEALELDVGENHLLWQAAETNGYAVVICG